MDFLEKFEMALERVQKAPRYTGGEMNTSVKGVFAVGDVRNTPLRQVITAVSDGAVAAVYAGKYMETLAPAKSV